jgi:hypothetical protein
MPNQNGKIVCHSLQLVTAALQHITRRYRSASVRHHGESPYGFARTNTVIAFVLNEEHDKFRWFSIARVPANDMNIVGTFIEALTRR